MMISPECYYEEYLKGKTEAEILTCIRSIKREIGHCKRIIEDSDTNTWIMPSPSTRIWANRLYLKRAIEALEEIGGKYKPSKQEENSIRFNENICNISKFVFGIGGFCGGYKTYTVSLISEFKVETGGFLFQAEDIKKNVTDEIVKEDFIDMLQSLYIGEWKHNYHNPCVMDGIEWDIRIEYKNEINTKHYSGSNAYPWSFGRLTDFFGYDITEE